MTTYSSPKNDLAERLQIVIHQKNATIAGLEAELKRYRDALAGMDPEAVPELVEAVESVDREARFMNPQDHIAPYVILVRAALAKVKKEKP